MLRQLLLSTVVVAPSSVRSKAPRLSAALHSRQHRKVPVVPKQHQHSSRIGTPMMMSTSSSSSAASGGDGDGGDGPKNDVRDTIIIGSGPAGYTAGNSF